MSYFAAQDAVLRVISEPYSCRSDYLEKDGYYNHERNEYTSKYSIEAFKLHGKGLQQWVIR